MIYPIVKFGDPVLDKPSAPVTVFDADLRKLVDDMFESMYAAHGVGLAAPQIGIAKRIAVIDVTRVCVRAKFDLRRWSRTFEKRTPKGWQRS
jgi:peptide deformylase